MAIVTSELPWIVVACLSALSLIGLTFIFIHPRFAALYAALNIAGFLTIKSNIGSVSFLVSSREFGTDLFASIEDSSSWPLVVVIIALLVYQMILEGTHRGWFARIGFGFTSSRTSGTGSPSVVHSNENKIISVNIEGQGTAHLDLSTHTYQHSATEVEIPQLESEADGQPTVDIPDKARIDACGHDLVRHSIDQARWINRAGEDELNRIVAENEENFVCLLGVAGAGKTALLARFVSQQRAHGVLTLAIKADLSGQDQPFDDFLETQTGFRPPLRDGISQLAKHEKVVVVIDQIDALANLVDLHSNRLNNLLTFIGDCIQIPNVVVICSCREFEFRHDVRLSSLGPHKVTLELPEWALIQPILEEAGIPGAENWPEDFKNILRTPQHLVVFLKYASSSDSEGIDVSLTYQQMLDELWKRSVDTRTKRVLIKELTDRLTQNESVTAPASAFDEYEAETAQLQSAGVLRMEGLRLGFSHQTLLEHARARLFVQQQLSLSAFILDRQDAIFVRPTAWHVLKYLREADPTTYDAELNALFENDLRIHIRYLLIDFIGQQPEPSESEISLFAKKLGAHSDVSRVLTSIRGSANWFSAFEKSHFPVLMKQPTEDAWAMIGVIALAWPFAREECLSLVEKHWINDPSKDMLTINAIQELDEWDDRSEATLMILIKRSKDFRLWWVVHIVEKFYESDPEFAIRILKAATKREFENNSHVNPFDSSEPWHKLPDIAKAAPAEFLTEFWDWTVTVMTAFQEEMLSPMIHRYPDTITHISDLDPRHQPLYSAVVDSVTLTAEQDPQRFLEITKHSWLAENGTIQMLIAQGLTVAASSIPKACIDFLTDDPRKLFLGPLIESWQSTSVELVAAVSPHISDETLRELEQYILNWSQYRADAELEEEQLQWDRESRFRLLQAIPENRRSPEVKAIVEECRAEFSEEPPSLGKARVGRVIEIPPMTSDEMLETDESDILEVLNAPEEKASGIVSWQESEDGGFTKPGGPRAAARELANLVTSNPDKAARIAKKALEEGNELPAQECFRVLRESSLPDDFMMNLVMELSNGKSVSEEYRQEAAILLLDVSKRLRGLPDEICDLLVDWLAMEWDGQYSAFRESEKRSEYNAKQPESILFAPRGGLFSTDRSFWPLAAVSHGLLQRDTPDYEKWYSIARRHVDSNASIRTWAAMCSQLNWILHRDRDQSRAVQFAFDLFAKHPTLITTREGLVLLANISPMLPEDFVKTVVVALADSGDGWKTQAAGEFFALLTIRDPETHNWASNELDRRLHTNSDSGVEAREIFRTGVAFAAAQLWEHYSLREKSTPLLTSVAKNATEGIASAFGRVFWASEDFPNDVHTRELMTAIADHPEILHPQFISDLVEVLADLCRFEQKLVLRVTQAIIDRFGSSFKSISSELYLAAPNLVNITMTLQRFPETRSEGLTLLERLMSLDLQDVYSILSEIDNRPSNTRRREPRKRRRRKPKK